MDLVKSVSEFDVRSWVNESTNQKYSLQQICEKFNLDIENDKVHKIFWNINITRKVVITPELLDYFGYSGTYRTLKITLMRLLSQNPYVKYTEVCKENDKYIVMTDMELESLMMQMKTSRVYELHILFSLMKMIVLKYCEYEKYFAKYHAHILACQNSTMLSTMHEMKRVILSERQTAAHALQRLEHDYCEAADVNRRLEHDLEHQRLVAIDERNYFEYERNRLEHELYRTVEEKKRLEFNLEMALKQAEHTAHERAKDAECAARLVTELEKATTIMDSECAETLVIELEKVAEQIIMEREQKTAAQKKQRNLGKFFYSFISCMLLIIFQLTGLLGTKDKRTWYLVCRKNPGYREAERRLIKTRSMHLIRKWENIDDNMNVGNIIKMHHNKHLTWSARDNFIKAKDDSFSDNLVENLINKILYN